MDALKVIWNQFLKNVDKAPGWVPLLIVVLLWLQLSGYPEEIKIGYWAAPVSTELLASMITLILYQLGDAIDERVFKERSDGKTKTRPRYKNAYKAASSDAQMALAVGESGLYSLASKLISAVEKEREVTFVYLFNEGAKFIRSLIIPLGTLGIISLLSRHFAVGVLLIVLSGLALYSYPWLKVEHIQRLYKVAALITKKPQYICKDTNGIKSYFWDGKYIVAGLTPADANIDSLKQLNIELGHAESNGDKEWIDTILAPELAFRRADRKTFDNRAKFLEKVKLSDSRETNIESIEIFGDRAIVRCIVIMRSASSEDRYSNLRLFVRHGGRWKLLGWANEPT